MQPFLRSKSWASRTAAAQAVDAIVSHVPQWAPEDVEDKEEDGGEEENRNLHTCCKTKDLY